MQFYNQHNSVFVLKIILVAYIIQRVGIVKMSLLWSLKFKLLTNYAIFGLGFVTLKSWFREN